MYVLGIESSCDETAAAVLDANGRVRSNIVHSQILVHAPFGGVVPEIASREHLERIRSVVEAALDEANVGYSDLEGIAVTKGPGLAGCLLVGTSFAKAVALVHQLPIIGINHLEGHLVASNLEASPPDYPYLGLLVSGGHTSLCLVQDFGHYRAVGETCDDAAGEAFDKVAKLFGLGYPGGAVIDRLASRGDPKAVRFPRGLQRKGNFDFSFSGLKTAVMNHLRKTGVPEHLEDLAASFQAAVVDVLVSKTFAAAEKYDVRGLVVSGGVAANSTLRAKFQVEAARRGFQLNIPSIGYCTDNAAMIAWAGQHRLHQGQRDTFCFTVEPRLSLFSESSGD